MPRPFLARLAGWLLACVLPLACQRTFEQPSSEPFCPGNEDLAAWVDPFIGTLGSGNAVPGALVPHGMVKLSPDTNAGSGSIDAYEYGNDKIEGFSHTHLQGPGGSGNGYSHVLLMPTTGPLQVLTADYASHFSHDREEAWPGHYAVELSDYGVWAELTASGRAGMHRYTFPASDQARVLIDLGHSRGESRGGRLEIRGDRIISGHGDYNVHPLINLLLADEAPGTGDSRVYFYASFDPPFSSQGTWQIVAGQPEPSEGSRTRQGARIGAWAGFEAADGVTVEVRVGISLINVEQAQANLAAEVGEKSFDQVRAEARAAWNCLLNRVQVAGSSTAVRTQFYTALYHSAFAPADYTEAGGRFYSAAGGQGQVFDSTGQRFYTDDWCAWDTYRTSRPLATIVEPERVDDIVPLPGLVWVPPTGCGRRVRMGYYAASALG